MRVQVIIKSNNPIDPPEYIKMRALDSENQTLPEPEINKSYYWCNVLTSPLQG